MSRNDIHVTQRTPLVVSPVPRYGIVIHWAGPTRIRTAASPSQMLLFGGVRDSSKTGI